MVPPIIHGVLVDVKDGNILLHAHAENDTTKPAELTAKEIAEIMLEAIGMIKEVSDGPSAVI